MNMNKGMQYLTAALLWFCLFGVPVSGAVGSFTADTVQEVYSSESRIPVTQANMVLQTRDGYLWVASYDGLIRYDGNHSKKFNMVDDSFPTRSIMTLFEDSQGRLWIGTNNAGLALYDNQGGFKIFGLKEGLPSNSVRAIAQDSEGTVFAATTLGLVAVSPDFSISKVAVPALDPLIITDLFVSRKDELWCVLNGGAVAVLQRGVLTKYFPALHFGEGIPRCAFQASGGAVYLGFTDNRVAVIGAGNAFKVYETGSRRFINSFYEDSHGRVWVCSNTGMGYFEQGTFFPVNGALLENSLMNMIEDFEGNLWFASARKGLLQVINSKFNNVSEAAALPPLVVNAAAMRYDWLYIGHDQGLVILDQNRRAVENDLTRLLHGIRVRSIIQDESENLWICTYSSFGILRYAASGEISSFNRKNHGLASDTVRCAFAGSKGRVYVGTGNGLSIIQGDRVVRNYAKKDGLHNPIIMNIYEDEAGVVYAGSDGGGIYVINGDSVGNYSEADGLPSGIIMRMQYDPVLKGLWISTENGLCFQDGNSFRRFDKLAGHEVNIFDIRFAGEDAIWLLGSDGIYIIGRKSLFTDEELEVDVLQARDGLSNTITANSWHWSEGNTLYLCTNGGVLSIDMDAVYKSNIAPRMIVSRVLVDGQAHNNPAQVSVPADASRVTVEFSLISYTYPKGNSVRFFLEGFDKKTTSMSTDLLTSVSYTNLPAGEHRFIISGRNKEGIPSGEVVLPIVKLPRPLEKPLVQLAAFCAIVAFFVCCSLVYTHSKTRALRKRKQEYREITEQALKAVADTIDAKDRYTSGHSKRVAEYSLKIARQLNMSEKEQEDLYYAALLHDIGKIGLEDHILNKPGKLSDEEYEKVKRHVTVGGDILKSITVIKDIATGARYHHERPDGKGYSEGLHSGSIPLFARIICVADAYDAMNSTRSYRKGQNAEYIIDQLERGKGKQFDDHIASIMIDLIVNRHIQAANSPFSQ